MSRPNPRVRHCARIVVLMAGMGRKLSRQEQVGSGRLSPAGQKAPKCPTADGHYRAESVRRGVGVLRLMKASASRIVAKACSLRSLSPSRRMNVGSICSLHVDDVPRC